MSEQLPDLWIDMDNAEIFLAPLKGTNEKHYTPHSKLQEAEKVLVGALEAIETILAHLDDPLTIKIFANAAIRIIKEHRQ